ncbi:hypothetical protein ACIOZM_08845 [Pseudomonas sp. NPDC087346]|uniref:hypothetical protein n=1 Tax=Pseudomonas sp. NPDC087346 TaxID=3364438 RepID=UPI0037FBF7C3
MTESEAPLPASDIPVTVCFPVTRADLSHGDSSSFKLSFTVTDKLSNTPDTDSPWSATTEVDVDLAGQRLSGLILREKPDDPSDDPGIIDPEKLGTNPLLMIALTTDPGFQPRDVINATYTAKIDGEPDIVVTVSGTVETDDFGQKSPCILQVANGQVVGGSTVTAWYELFRGSVRIGRSRIATARVLGGGLSDLKPPRFQKSVNGVLDPLDPANLSGANGQVELLGHRPGDTVQLIVEGSPGPGSPVFNPLPLNASSRANFPLSSAFIAANMGKQVTFSYLLFRNGKQFTSQTLTASVSKIPENHPGWTVLSIDGANNVDNSLDSFALNDSTRTRVSAWPHISEFQRIWLRYFGTNDNGTPFEHTTYSGDLLPAGGIVDGLLPEAPVANLRKLKWGSNLRVELKVTFDGSLDESTAQTLVRTYEVWSSVIEEDFPVTLLSLRAGESFQHDHMKFECVRGHLTLGSVYSGPNEHVDGHGIGVWQSYDALPYKVYFNDRCSRISFWYFSNSLHAGDVKFFDVSGNFLGTCPLVNRYQLVNHQITFEAQGITRMDINVGSPSAGGQFYFDSFRLTVQR